MLALIFSTTVISHRPIIRIRSPSGFILHRSWRFDTTLKQSSRLGGMAGLLSAKLKRTSEDPDPGSVKTKRIKIPLEDSLHSPQSESLVSPGISASGDVSTGAAPNNPEASIVSEDLVQPEDIKSNEARDTVSEGANITHSDREDVGKGKERTGKKSMRRGRRGTRNDDTVQSGPKIPRLPKRQCALLIGFCGSGYSGMQIQPDHHRTIEGVLFQAMVRAGAVSRDNADNPVKIGLARAARTDAGVHAAGNLVSLKMITSIPDVPDIVARINEELPPEIRLWGYVRVQNSFNARLVCDSRKYTYFFPSYLLIPPKPGSGLEHTLRQYVTDNSPTPGSFWDPPLNLTKEEELIRKRAWRAGPGYIKKLKVTARKFEGTHNFHNFTVARDFGDRSNQRHMRKIEVANPVVYGETEWISVLFHGQSFMLHQRKMMAAMVLSCRTATPEHIIDEIYGPHVVFIPKMPSLGLLLEEPIFDSYNTRMVAINERLQPSDPGYRPAISFDSHRDAIDAFKQKFIYDNMREVEDQSGLFNAWIRSVDSYAGSDLLYLNPKGTIPPAAIIKKGVRRENPFREKKRFDATSFSAEDGVGKSFDDEEEEWSPVDKRDLADTEG